MEIKKFIPMVTSKAILCEDLVQILPDIYYFWRGGWKKKKNRNWMKLLVIWLTIVRFMCVWKDRVCSSSMVNLVLCNQCLPPLMLWVWISIRARCTTFCDKVRLYCIEIVWRKLESNVIISINCVSTEVYIKE